MRKFPLKIGRGRAERLGVVAPDINISNAFISGPNKVIYNFDKVVTAALANQFSVVDTDRGESHTTVAAFQFGPQQIEFTYGVQFANWSVPGTWSVTVAPTIPQEARVILPQSGNMQVFLPFITVDSIVVNTLLNLVDLHFTGKISASVNTGDLVYFDPVQGNLSPDGISNLDDYTIRCDYGSVGVPFLPAGGLATCADGAADFTQPPAWFSQWNISQP